jgi:hypothetical protein
LEKTIKTKKEKYATLAEEMKKGRQVKQVSILPIVISATGVIPTAANYQKHKHAPEEDGLRDGSDAEGCAFINSKNKCARSCPGIRTCSLPL